MKTNNKILASLAGAALLVALVVLLSYWAFNQIDTAAATRKQTYALIVRANALLSEIVDAETGQRGYALTGNRDFLVQYLAVRNDLRGDLNALRQGTKVKAATERLDALVPLLDAKLAELAQVIELRQRDDAKAVLALVSSSQGMLLMNSIRGEIASYIAVEDVVLAQNDADLQSKMRQLFIIITTFCMFTLLFAVSFAYLIYRETRQRLKNLVHLETQSLLKTQQELNDRLQKANLVLQVSEEKLAVTLNSIGDAVITTDTEGHVTMLNPLAERLTGWKRKDAIGRPVEEIFKIINHDSRQPSLAPVMDTLRHGTQHGLANHTILISRNGAECSIADSCSPIRDRAGHVAGAVLVFRDVTDEDAARQALRDQQFYTRSLIESNVDALMTTNPSGIITDVNKQMEVLTGASRDELIGAPFKNYFTDPERAEAGIKLVLREKKVSNYELMARARDGSETAVSYNATTFYDRDRRLQGVFAAARDVTESKRLDRALQEKNAELESARTLADKANLAKSDFLSSMSHELRTPLNAILGFAQLMESGAPPPTPIQKRNLDQILKAGWYLLDLINEILDLAVIESGKVTLSREPVSLVEVMLECRSMIEPQALKRGIRMTFPRLDVPYFVNADRTRVKQILINLLFNSIKYNRTGGTVTVECALSPPDSIRISIRDTGVGLAPEQLTQLFQPFNRIGKDAGIEEGTGIGLVVTKRLVELMGGTIGADSTVGVGSVFWIELNLTHAPQLSNSKIAALAQAQAQAQGPDSMPIRTLLYVEDNPANLELVEQLIVRRPDLHLLSAADGDLGIELARACQPKVILMDINLPGISGVEAMQILRLDPSTSHIPIIALSANALARDIDRAFEAGFFNYLTKPIKVNEFMDALDAALKFSETSVLEKEPAL